MQNIKLEDFKLAILGKKKIFRTNILLDNSNVLKIRLINDNAYLVWIALPTPCTPRFIYQFDSHGELSYILTRYRIACCILTFCIAPFILVGSLSYLYSQTFFLIQDIGWVFVLLALIGTSLQALNIYLVKKTIKNEIYKRIQEAKSI